MEILTHKLGVEIAYKWVLKNCGCGVAFKELYSAASNGEYPDVIAFASWYSVLIEVKVSRSDFLRDRYKPFRKDPTKGMGNRRYYCCPKGMIKTEELPEGWGLVYIDKGRAKLEYQPYTEDVREYGTIKRHYSFAKNHEAEQMLMYSALRRLFIKGYVKHIYDKQYNRNTTAQELIELNEQPDLCPENSNPYTNDTGAT